MRDTDVPNEFLETATGLAEYFDLDPKVVYKWIERREGNGFPEHKTELGKYKFYDRREVETWWELYQKAIKRIRQSNGVNNA